MARAGIVALVAGAVFGIVSSAYGVIATGAGTIAGDWMLDAGLISPALPVTTGQTETGLGSFSGGATGGLTTLPEADAVAPAEEPIVAVPDIKVVPPVTPAVEPIPAATQPAATDTEVTAPIVETAFEAIPEPAAADTPIPAVQQAAPPPAATDTEGTAPIVTVVQAITGPPEMPAPPPIAAPIMVTPEPATAVLLASGIAVLAAFRRRRRTGKG